MQRIGLCTSFTVLSVTATKFPPHTIHVREREQVCCLLHMRLKWQKMSPVLSQFVFKLSSNWSWSFTSKKISSIKFLIKCLTEVEFIHLSNHLSIHSSIYLCTPIILTVWSMSHSSIYPRTSKLSWYGWHHYISGQLCGDCKEGYSLNAVSNECVSDEVCQHGVHWLIPLFVLPLIMIVIFMYGPDIKEGTTILRIHEITINVNLTENSLKSRS